MEEEDDEGPRPQGMRLTGQVNSINVPSCEARNRDKKDLETRGAKPLFQAQNELIEPKKRSEKRGEEDAS